MKQDNYDELILGWIFVIMTVFFVLLAIIDHVSTKSLATTKFLPPNWYDTREVVQENTDWDLSKTTDIWKLNPKTVYSMKSLETNVYIWRYLTDEMGLSDEAAAGIFGNMMVECGSRSFNLYPYIYNPSGDYYGLCQWNTFGHHSSIAGGTLDEQLYYLNRTIRGEMGEYQYQRFLDADTPEEASIVFGQWYERCFEPYGRQAEARRAYERFS